MKKRLKNSRYITGFDGLRSLAVIGVILYHLLPSQMRGGFLGVPVFFVVSGYLITDLLLQEWKQNGKIKLGKFYVRRMKRLYPALVTMLIASSAYITLFQRNLLNNLRGNVVSSLLYVNNWWQIEHGLSYFDRFAGESPFTHIWSLAVEAQNYLFWPIIFILLMKLVKNRGKIYITISIAALISAIWMAILFIPGQDPTRVYYGTDTRLFSILMGSGLAFIWPSTRLKAKIPKQAKKVLNSIGLVSLLLLTAAFLFLNDGTTFLYYGGMFLISLVCVVLVAITAHPGASLNKWLTNPVFNWLGKRSYGIYLYQFPIMIFYEAKFNVADHLVFHTIMEIVLILLVTELSYRFVEKPLRFFNYRGLFAKLKTWVQAPLKSKEKIILLSTSLVTLIALIGIVMAPTNQVDANQQELQKQIEANQKEAQKTQASTETTETSSEGPDMAEKYGLTNRQVTKAENMQVTAFGDSVLLAGAGGLKEIFPKMVIDGEVGRQVDDSPPLLQALKDKKQLEDTVLLSLGTNGPFTDDEFDQMMKIIGNKRRVFVLNVHVPTQRWQNEVNQKLGEMAEKYENITLIDWYGYSSSQPSWFYDDQVHPNPEGIVPYCSLIAKALLTGQ
ncbi:acyltransferase family protein [Candidatus Enterococcus ferrettii]|uniref:Acyltransferase 3 domain-containing protein n=1 Tax=Candidatus Enterococcus ferrettii TaxID=2815324 RepID=A0ABV0EWV4_9ENTE|nr:acyltransferase family protein [Enterococcus sp. 665A]MBO1338776.1 acetyltransferase [Enterococcus sp. 665A]